MSFILDALKKCERERESSVSAKLSAAPAEIKQHGIHWNWPVILAILLAVSLVAVVMLTSTSPPVEQEHAAVAARQPDTRARVQASPGTVRSLAGEANTVPRPAVAESESRPPISTPTTSRSATMYSELPADLRQELGPLHVDAHAYSTVSAERFVLINLKRYVEGSTTSRGALVREITPEGVNLEFRNTEFFLPRN